MNEENIQEIRDALTKEEIKEEISELKKEYDDPNGTRDKSYIQEEILEYKEALKEVLI